MEMKIIPKQLTLAATLIGVLMLSSIALAVGNKALMNQKKLKTILLNETVIKQIDALDDNVTISFIGRVVKKPDGSVEILVEQIDKKHVEDVVINSGGRYIQYMSFEEMQKLPLTTDQKAASKFYGGGAATK